MSALFFPRFFEGDRDGLLLYGDRLALDERQDGANGTRLNRAVQTYYNSPFPTCANDAGGANSNFHCA